MLAGALHPSIPRFTQNCIQKLNSNKTCSREDSVKAQNNFKLLMLALCSSVGISTTYVKLQRIEVGGDQKGTKRGGALYTQPDLGVPSLALFCTPLHVGGDQDSYTHSPAFRVGC